MDFEGWAMFMVAFLILFLLGRALRFSHPGSPGRPTLKPAVRK